MSEPFIAEIRIFAGNFAPRNWALCDGQLLQIAQNTALFSLVGTTYGGDGRTTFGLPNLQGRAPMHAGRGPGLANRRLGEMGGVTTITLSEAQMPNHTHTLVASSDDGDSLNPNSSHVGAGNNMFTSSTTGLGAMAAGSLPAGGGGQAHSNLQPSLTLNFIIALAGLFPSRS